MASPIPSHAHTGIGPSCRVNTLPLVARGGASGAVSLTGSPCHFPRWHGAPVIILRRWFPHRVHAMVDKRRQLDTRVTGVTVREERNALAVNAIVRVEVMLSGIQRIDNVSKVGVTVGFVAGLPLVSAFRVGNERN